MVLNIAVAPSSIAVSEMAGRLQRSGCASHARLTCQWQQPPCATLGRRYERIGIDLGDAGLASGLQVWARIERAQKDIEELEIADRLSRLPYYTERLQVRLKLA